MKDIPEILQKLQSLEKLRGGVPTYVYFGVIGGKNNRTVDRTDHKPQGRGLIYFLKMLLLFSCVISATFFKDVFFTSLAILSIVSAIKLSNMSYFD